MVKLKFILEKGSERAVIAYQGPDAYAGADAFTFSGSPKLIALVRKDHEHIDNVESMSWRTLDMELDHGCFRAVEIEEPSSGKLLLDNGATLIDSRFIAASPSARP